MYSTEKWLSRSRTVQSVWAVFALSGNILITSGNWSLHWVCKLYPCRSRKWAGRESRATTWMLQPGTQVAKPPCPSLWAGPWDVKPLSEAWHHFHCIRLLSSYHNRLLMANSSSAVNLPLHRYQRAKVTCCSLTSKATFLNTGVTGVVYPSPPQYPPRWPETVVEHQSNYISWWYQQDRLQGKGKTA